MASVSESEREYQEMNQDLDSGASQVEEVTNPYQPTEGVLDLSEVEALPDDEVRYAREMKISFGHLLKRVWDDEKKTGHNLPDEQYQTFYNHGTSILAAMHSKVLLAIMKGTLVEEAKVPGSTVAKIIAANEQRWKSQTRGKRYQPMIYQQWLCDKDGKAPGVDVIKGIRNAIRRYVRQDEVVFAEQVDRKFSNCPALNWKSGERRYLSNTRRIANADRFCTALLMTTKKPYRRPLVETGYTNNGATRLSQHRKHTHSNYLLNLVDAICCILFPNLHVHQLVVFHIFDPDQAWVGEILFDRLSGGWVDEGYGFTHFHAGWSVKSSSEFSDDEFEDWCEFMLVNTAYDLNMDIELKRVEYHMEKLQAEVEAEYRETQAQVKAAAERYDRGHDVFQTMIEEDERKVQEASEKIKRASENIERGKRALEYAKNHFAKQE